MRGETDIRFTTSILLGTMPKHFIEVQVVPTGRQYVHNVSSVVSFLREEKDR